MGGRAARPGSASGLATGRGCAQGRHGEGLSAGAPRGGAACRGRGKEREEGREEKEELTMGLHGQQQP
jgi:hypothetical protein